MNPSEVPIHRAAVGVRITDFDGRVLLVSNPYRENLVLVGREKTDTMLYVFDTEPIDSTTELVLQEEEISEVFWLGPEEAIARHTEPGRERLRAALRARESGGTLYLDNDRVIGG